MTDGQVALGSDRLPWLDDEPQRHVAAPSKPAAARKAQSGTRSFFGWAAAVLLAVAGTSYWLGVETADKVEPALRTAPRPPTITAPLPEPRPAPPQASEPQVRVAAPPEVRPAPMPVVSVAPPQPRAAARKRAQPRIRRESPPTQELKRVVSDQRDAPAVAPPPTVVVIPPRAPTQTRRLTAWPARQSAGASGRLVQIGAFGSRHQAKLGWRRMVRSYPAVGRLRAVVVETRNSRGRRFYRFQIGTTSQAHSEVLCQRMRTIRFSCAVVGLPGRAKVER
jgi:hypothetical protein